jgi:L-asparaginase
MESQLLAITTGGTIDKIYPRIINSLGYEFGMPALQQILSARLQPHEYIIHNFPPVDSTQMTDEMRERIMEVIEQSNSFKILITHGTDTLVETARFLAQSKAIMHSRHVVLTGAMQPYSTIHSDAEFNIACALGSLNTLKKGVFISMHGKLFLPSNAIKDPDSVSFREN